MAYNFPYCQNKTLCCWDVCVIVCVIMWVFSLFIYCSAVDLVLMITLLFEGNLNVGYDSLMYAL